MVSRLIDVLEHKEENYILPFFWQRGEEEDVLREEMARIRESGIRAVCVEARPHPDYLGPKWWKDMDVIMDEARNRGMRVWVLDDDHFPTGHAAGRLKDAPAQLRRLFLSETHIDAIGPNPHSSFIVPPYEDSSAKVIAVIAIKRHPITGDLTDERVDLTSLVKQGKLHWRVPEGYWRIFTMAENDHGGDVMRKDYLNPLAADSVRVLIDTIYEAFFERYQADFGQTFAGFFSDEPGFYNDKQTYDFESKPGKKDVSLPWSAEMPKLLERQLGPDYSQLLPLLWHEGSENTSVVRYHYMNIVSQLYAEHFTAQIGNWCREHAVEYIGHVLEDNNVHTRLGCGAGHFFRALGGQDMSGIDAVLWQLSPGFDEFSFKWLAGEADSEFFNYGLAKMASSLAHLDPQKKGRTMAEVFGAYGWAEGLKLMKWMTDHMLVRGVNYFVPHAFSARPFPDPDCPPHMYARGMNPQFRYYRYLNHYTNRVSHLLSGGRHIASAAVLYHAEAEWSGEYMYFHKPVKQLMRNQIDCDVLPCDVIVERVSCAGSKLQSNEQMYDCLIVPYSEALPTAVLLRFVELAEQGLPIYFIEGLPVRSCEGADCRSILAHIGASKSVEIVALGDIAAKLKAAGFYDIEVKDNEPFLRSMHVQHADLDVFMLFNEHPIHTIATTARLPVHDQLFFYDAFDNKIIESGSKQEGGGSTIAINLAPFETIFVVAGKDIQLEAGQSFHHLELQESAITGPWRIATAASEQYPAFTDWGQSDKLTDLSLPDALPDFSGTIRYEAQITAPIVETGDIWIELGDAFESAELFVNGVSAGVRISTPYRFDVSNLLAEGSHTLAVEVTNTLVKAHLDSFSRIAQHEPSGLLGPVRLLYR